MALNVCKWYPGTAAKYLFVPQVQDKLAVEQRAETKVASLSIELQSRLADWRILSSFFLTCWPATQQVRHELESVRQHGAGVQSQLDASSSEAQQAPCNQDSMASPDHKNPVVQSTLPKRVANAKEEGRKTTSVRSTSSLFGKLK
ncbi:hypothetical protein ABBQ38_014738 [Trebouxia sp. C0009 RCD-2024]